jgi:hypothetical protein
VVGELSEERRSIEATFTDARYTLPPRPPMSRAERRAAREERRRAREGRQRRPPAAVQRGDGEGRPGTHIVLDATEPFWVERNDMRLRLSTRLLVDVGGAEPRLRGRVDVHEGRMTVGPGAYDIDGGYVAFWGGGAEPEMYLRGSFRSRRGRRRRVAIFGPLGAAEARIE